MLDDKKKQPTNLQKDTPQTGEKGGQAEASDLEEIEFFSIVPEDEFEQEELGTTKQ